MKRRINAMLLVLVMVVSMLSACGGGDKTPSTESQQTSTGTETPSTETEKPSTETEKPSTETDKPSADASKYDDNVTDSFVIKIHYNRPDGNYTDWSVWGWELDTDGQDYPFAEENGEMVATIKVDPGAAQFGYIVRTPDWGKDVGEDQFIECAQYITGTLHVFIESGVKGHTTLEGKDITTGTKLISAKYNKGEIAVRIAGATEVTKDDLVVKGDEGTIDVTEVTAGTGDSFRVKLASELDLMKIYTITYAGSEYAITMPDFFSSAEFEEEYTYAGDDLGATWSKDSTKFRVWAPTASAVSVNLYKSGTLGTDDLIESIEMKKDVNGTWVVEKSGDLNGTYYTYSVNVNGSVNEACDPYARTTGVNGERAMVIDLDSTDPKGWDKDKNPNADKTFNDAVIYELHIRDLGTHESSGITNIGKFLSLTEHGTKTQGGVATGVDHLKDLGITHLHILPMYDYSSVDESKLDTPQFNWGYDPKNYNVPEGSYSTDPFNGEVRVKETKEMVQSLHEDGISVVMDVVYNHVSSAGSFCFNKIVPQYFTRVTDGVYSNGSGCGNDTASERAMVKKYIVDSVLYWAEEYHIDGFRFDLAGLIDTETTNAIMEAVHAVRPDVVFYGEGWTMGTNTTKEGYSMTTQVNSKLVEGFAFFSDTLRDAIKGSVFDKGTGYVSGAAGQSVTIADCFMGLAGSWCTTPAQSINYASAHDNNTLYDRLQLSRPEASQEELIKMNNLSAAIVMTAQGIPFIHAGEELLRSKVNADGSFNENSYNAPDSVNWLKWSDLEKEEYKNVYEYYKGLIAFRKAHGALRLTNAEDVAKHVSEVKGLDSNVLAFCITGDDVKGEKADKIFVIFNPNTSSTEVELPEGDWEICVNGEKAGTKSLGEASGKVTVEGISAMVLIQD